jgi:uncharacterized membrane protein
MNFAPLLHAPPEIQLHVLASAVTLLLTALIFTRARGTRMHRRLGWAWVIAMGALAGSGFMITSGGGLIGPFSWIHGLSAFVLVALPLAVLAARRRDRRSHRGWMLGMVWGGLVVAGGFTLLPGRLMHAVILGG